MPFTGNEAQTEGYQRFNQGPQVICNALVMASSLPTTILAGASWTSGVIVTAGWKSIMFAATSTAIGALTIQRYLDLAGTVSLGSLSSQALSPGAANYLCVNDGLPYVSFVATITNPGGVSATISKTALILAST